MREFQDEYVPRIPVCLEIKDPLATGPLIAFLKSQDLNEQIHVTSFSWSAILQARSALAVPTGFLCRLFNTGIVERCVARGIDQICPPVSELDGDMVEFAHQQGLVVRAWGVRERNDIDRLFETGVDGATTNWPDWITGHPEYT
jgi:glycerophosphoryl diester phosphodiesterase